MFVAPIALVAALTAAQKAEQAPPARARVVRALKKDVIQGIALAEFQPAFIGGGIDIGPGGFGFAGGMPGPGMPGPSRGFSSAGGPSDESVLKAAKVETTNEAL